MCRHSVGLKARQAHNLPGVHEDSGGTLSVVSALVEHVGPVREAVLQTQPELQYKQV